MLDLETSGGSAAPVPPAIYQDAYADHGGSYVIDPATGQRSPAAAIPAPTLNNPTPAPAVQPDDQE